MMINFCPNCGKPVEKEDQMCGFCGFSLSTFFHLQKNAHSQAFSQPDLIPQIAEKVYPKVLKIETNKGFGSGFLCDISGLVVTNYHVISGATDIFVKFSKDVKFPIESIVTQDAVYDYSILRIKLPENLFKEALALADSDKLKLGEEVIALGNPLGEEKTVSTGIISAYRPENNRIQMTTPISKGSSGGPVLNLNGEVVGIAVSGLKEGQNINYMVPINLIKGNLKTKQYKWEFIHKWQASSKKLTALEFSFESDLLFSASAKTIRIWRIDNYREVDNISLNTEIVGFGFYSKEIWSFVLEGGNETVLKNSVKIENRNLGKVMVGRTHEGLIMKNFGVISFSLNFSSHNFSTSGAPYCKIIGTKEGEAFLLEDRQNDLPIRLALTDRSPVTDIQMSEGGFLAASVQENGVVSLIDLETRPIAQKLRSFEWSPSQKANACCLSPQLDTLCVGNENGKVFYSRIANVSKDKFNFSPAFKAAESINKLRFSKDGNFLAAGTEDGKIFLFKRVAIS